MKLTSTRAAWSTILAATAVFLAVVISGCGGDDASTTPSANASDSMFVKAMIPHHESAIEMAKLAKTRSKRAEVLELSAAIIKTQQAEIDELREMVNEMPATNDSMMDDNQMSAMNSEVEDLAAAEDFDQAFIDAMIPHHQSAIEMAEQVLTSGESVEVQRLAQNVISAQQREIAQMEKWSADWFGVAPTESTGVSMGHMDDSH